MKKTLLALLLALSLSASAFAEGFTLKMKVSEMPHMVCLKGASDTLTLGPGENAVLVNISPGPGVNMEYFVSIYDNNLERYLTPESFTGSYENMVGPVSGGMAFTGLAPGGNFTVYIASAVDLAMAEVSVSGARLSAASQNSFELSSAAVVGDCPPPGGFRPDAGLSLFPDLAVTRGVMATLVNNLLPAPSERMGRLYANGSGYSDIPIAGIYRSDIEIMIERNIARGVGGGLFAPNAEITTAEAVKMLLASMGYGPYAESLGEWPENYMSCARALGLPVEKEASEKALWSDVREMIEAALFLPHMAVTEFNVDGKVKMSQSPEICYASIKS